MNDNVTRFLAGISAGRDRAALQPILRALADRYSSQCHTSAGLTFTAANAVDRTGASITYGTANGVPFSIAATTNMAALAGTILQNTFNVYVHYIDVNGTLSTAMGNPGATWPGVTFPPTPEGKAIIGYVRVNPTSANFIGGTTNLDAAGVNVVFVSFTGAVDPTLLVG